MAQVTLSITVDNLVNDELDDVADKFLGFLSKDTGLPGKVTDVTEDGREEDEEESDE